MRNRSLFAGHFVILVLFLGPGAYPGSVEISQPPSDGPGDTTSPGAAKNRLQPGGYYSFDFETFAYSAFEIIDTRTGEATHLWSVGIEPGPTPLGLAFDLDGSMYTTLNVLSFDPGEVRSQLARVDTSTGAVTLIGQPFWGNTAGGEIDACGNYYATGFQVDHLGYIWGDGYLHRIDKYTGVPTPIGFTGLTDWMDLAFDAQGTLWATTRNQLYTLDTETGASTFVTDIHGVPDAAEPHNMEVMSIAFDDKGDLYGTGTTVFWDDPRGSPVMKIDVASGAAALVGYTHQYYNHGGDTAPKMVKVAHRKIGGGFTCATIGLNDLPAHLAHGDYVPGTNGHGCSCP